MRRFARKMIKSAAVCALSAVFVVGGVVAAGVCAPGVALLTGSVTAVAAQTPGWHTIDGAVYYYGSDGKPLTGWQDIDGNRYYFNASGQRQTGFISVDGCSYYMNADGTLYTDYWWQKIGDEWMYFDEVTHEILSASQPEGTKVGIDVSEHQKDIDWSAVKDFGIEFAMIRLGYVGPELDENYLTNIAEANEVGIPVGVYYYSRATAVTTAIAEAQYVIDNMRGYTISYPVAIDVENAYATSWESMDSATITAIVKAFCQEIEREGYTPMIYSNLNWLRNHLDMSELEGIEIWQARYYYEPSDDIAHDIWQGGSTAHVSGIDENTVDIDFAYKDYDTLITPRTQAAESVSMYRLYNPNSGEHFYTANTYERDNLIDLGWVFEGIGWTAPVSSSTPVYRLYNANAGEHHYTMNTAERDNLISVGWSYEGIGWYSDDDKSVAVYRQYNPNAFANNHNYTINTNENDWLVSLGWNAEGIGWYGLR